jgi:hypothetical protein
MPGRVRWRLPANEPFGYGLTNLMRRIFLKKMLTGDRDLLLVAPGAAKLEQVAGEDGAWITIYQQFRNIVRHHPVAVVFDDPRRMRRRARTGSVGGMTAVDVEDVAGDE